jgi:hypothetical protein
VRGLPSLDVAAQSGASLYEICFFGERFRLEEKKLPAGGRSQREWGVADRPPHPRTPLLSAGTPPSNTDTDTIHNYTEYIVPQQM